MALRNDPEIAEMVAQGRVFELLRDPRFVDVINDPALVAQVKQFDLKKALEYRKKEMISDCGRHDFGFRIADTGKTKRLISDCGNRIPER